MRILMLAQFYPPTMGGEEQHVRTLSTALALRGHQVAVATLSHPGLPQYEEQEAGVRVYRIPTLMQRARWLYSDTGRRHAPPFPDPEAGLALRRIIAQERPEIVHAHNWLLHSFLPLKKWSGAGLVVTLHDYSLACTQKRLMRKGVVCDGPSLLKCLDCTVGHYGTAKGIMTLAGNGISSKFEARLVDMFLAVSRATATGNGLDRLGVPYQVIPNFLLDEPGPQHSDAAPFLAQLPKEPYLLFVGDVVPDKGVGTLLQAYAGLKDPPPLVLIGRLSPDWPGQLPPGVIALGSWPHDAVMQAWRRSFLGLLPSQVPETFGIAILEAMSAGRPVIASRIGGLVDVVIDGLTGSLVPPGDVEALRSSIEHFVSNPDLARSMGEAAAKRADEFRADRVVPRIEQVYCQIRGGPTTDEKSANQVVTGEFRAESEGRRFR